MSQISLEKISRKETTAGNFKIVVAMKKIMNVFVLVATVAMVLVSCQKNEIRTPEKQEVQFTINSGQKSKTLIEATVVDGKTVYKPSWDGNEKLGVLFSVPTGDTKVADLTIFENANEPGTLASFQGTATVNDNGTFYSFCPASAFARGYNDGDVRLDLKREQYPAATSFDPECDILVAKPYDYTVTDGQVKVDGLSFARIMSVLRINLKTDFADVQNEFVKSVSFTAGDVKITGYARIFLDKPHFTGDWASSGDEYCTVTAKYESDLVSIAGSANSVYVVVAPVTIPQGKELVFDIETTNYKITKNVTSPEMTFTAGEVEPINLTIKEENCVRIEASTDDYSGQYLIAGQEDESWYAAKKYESGNYLTAIPLKFSGENIVLADELSDCYMTITKVVGGDYDGMYTIVDAGGKYLSAVSSSSNYMKAVENPSADAYWTLERNEDSATYSLSASKSQYTNNDMRFNYNSGSPRVSCYNPVKTKQPYLTLFSIDLIKEDHTPMLEVEQTAVELPAVGGEGEVAVTARNVTDVQVRVLDEVQWLTATYADGKVSYVATENDSEERTAIVEVYAVDIDNNEIVKSITVTQAGKPAEGGEVEATTWVWEGGSSSDFKALSNVTVNGLGSDYAAANAPYNIKLDGTGDYFIIKVDGAIQTVTVGVKMIGGATTSYLDIQGSTDGTSFTSVQKHTISGQQNAILELTTTNSFDASYRYVKFYFTKGSNIGVGPITITYISDGNSGGEEPEQPEVPVTPELTVNPEMVEVSASGGDAEFEYTVTNPTEGVTVSASTEADWISDFSYVDSKVKFSVAENTATEAREATIELSYTGAEPKTVTVKQAAAENVEPEEPEGEMIEVTDVLTRTTTGVTSTSYASWSGKTSNSSAVYAGQSAGGNSSIQLRSKNSNSGVITTASGGKVKKVKVEWNSTTASGRTLQVYGKSTAYSNPTELYSSATQGTLLGTIVNGTSTELVISGDYAFVGLRSASDAMYLTEIQITWETTSGSGGGTVVPDPTPEPEPDPTPEPEPEPTGNTFGKYSGTLTEGDYIIAYSGKAMKATISKNRFGYETVESVEIIENPDPSIVWHVEKNGNYWTIYNAAEGKYAAGTGKKNEGALLTSGTDDESLWTVTGSATYEFVNKKNQ